MSDGERPLLDEVLDYTVYAPLGLALTVLEDLPSLVEKGKSKISGQLAVARFVAKMASRQARNRVEDLLAPNPAASTDRDPVATVEVIETVATDVAPPPAESLAIAEYDSLAASQVVARLAGLSASELAALRTYEVAHRRRRTILSRIEQLEADNGE